MCDGVGRRGGEGGGDGGGGVGVDGCGDGARAGAAVFVLPSGESERAGLRAVPAVCGGELGSAAVGGGL